MLGLPIHIIGLFDKEGNKISFSPSNVLIQAVRYGFVAESIEINFEVIILYSYLFLILFSEIFILSYKELDKN